MTPAADSSLLPVAIFTLLCLFLPLLSNAAA